MFARAGDYVVFVREPGNMFDPSCVMVGLRGQVCIHCLGYLEARVASIINLLGTLPKYAVYFCVLCNYYIIFVTTR